MNETFTDVILRYESEQYSVHKILLAKRCQWFRDYFKAHPTDNSPQDSKITIDLPVDPERAIKPILDALYGQPLHLTIKNAPSLLKITVFYGIPFMKDNIIEFLKKTITDEIDKNNSNKLYYVDKLISYDLIDEANIIAPSIAEKLKEYFDKPGQPGLLTKEIVFNAVKDGRVFASIIKDKILTSEGTGTLNEERRVEVVDLYVGDREITNKEEQKALASVANWDSPNAYLYLVNYKCDWLPANISRKLIKKVFENRRTTCNSFEKEANEIKKDRISRWIGFSWVANVANSKGIKENSSVNIIEFMRTLGYFLNQERVTVNPTKFGFCSIICKDKVFYKLDPENIFKYHDPKSKECCHFASYSIDPNKRLSIDISFGENNIVASERVIIVDEVSKKAGCEISAEDIRKNTFAPSNKKLSALINAKVKKEVELNKSVNFKAEFDELRIQNQENCPVLRISSLEIFGRFI